MKTCGAAGCDAAATLNVLGEDDDGYAVWSSWCSRHYGNDALAVLLGPIVVSINA